MWLMWSRNLTSIINYVLELLSSSAFVADPRPAGGFAGDGERAGSEKEVKRMEAKTYIASLK